MKIRIAFLIGAAVLAVAPQAASAANPCAPSRNGNVASASAAKPEGSGAIVSASGKAEGNGSFVSASGAKPEGSGAVVSASGKPEGNGNTVTASADCK